SSPETPPWTALYRRRATVEREFGRLKHGWALSALRCRTRAGSAARRPDYARPARVGARPRVRAASRGVASPAVAKAPRASASPALPRPPDEHARPLGVLVQGRS